jgi:hypothetical protein
MQNKLLLFANLPFEANRYLDSLIHFIYIAYIYRVVKDLIIFFIYIISIRIVAIISWANDNLQKTISI